MTRNQTGTIPANDPPPDPSPGDLPKADDPPGTDGQNQGGEKKAEQDSHQKMTADQYLKRAPQGAGIGELVRSLYKTKVMSFGEWENTVKDLLKKQVR
jgi:hypothetical protein